MQHFDNLDHYTEQDFDDYTYYSRGSKKPYYEEEVKEEPRYTVEEVLEAIQLLTPNAAPWNWVPEIKEHLNKAKDPQYLEYLRLKAIYE